MSHWVGQKRKVEVYLKKVYLKLDQNTFETIWNKTMHNDHYFIEPAKASNFIEKQLIGGIKKSELDDERINEINGLDMM